MLQQYKINEVYESIWKDFDCTNTGTISYSKQWDVLLLISNYSYSNVSNRWVGDVLYLIGYGKNGDQNINLHLNKMLAESPLNEKTLYLFKKLMPGKYQFLGKPKLDGAPFKEVQRGINGIQRYVWIFPLRVENYKLSNGSKIENTNIET